MYHSFRCLLLRTLPSGLHGAGPRDVQWVHPENFTLLPRADFRISGLFFSFPFHVIKLVFSKYKAGRGQGVKIWKFKILLMLEVLQGYNLTFNTLLSKDQLKVGFLSHYEFLYYKRGKNFLLKIRDGRKL